MHTPISGRVDRGTVSNQSYPSRIARERLGRTVVYPKPLCESLEQLRFLIKAMRPYEAYVLR